MTSSTLTPSLIINFFHSILQTDKIKQAIQKFHWNFIDPYNGEKILNSLDTKKSIVITSKSALGPAYSKAHFYLMKKQPMTPKILAHMWATEFGLYHRYKKNIFGYSLWIEFPDAADYIAFLSTWGD